jgi:hypothetical protein
MFPLLRWNRDRRRQRTADLRWRLRLLHLVGRMGHPKLANRTHRRRVAAPRTRRPSQNRFDDRTSPDSRLVDRQHRETLPWAPSNRKELARVYRLGTSDGSRNKRPPAVLDLSGHLPARRPLPLPATRRNPSLSRPTPLAAVPPTNPTIMPVIGETALFTGVGSGVLPVVGGLYPGFEAGMFG